MPKKVEKFMPKPPKKPLTSFFIYKNDVFQKVKSENPDAKITELTKMISEDWRALSDNKKEKYEKLKDIERSKYEKEVDEYERKYGPIPSRKKLAEQKEQEKKRASKKKDESSDDDASSESDKPKKKHKH